MVSQMVQITHYCSTTNEAGNQNGGVAVNELRLVHHLKLVSWLNSHAGTTHAETFGIHCISSSAVNA